MIEDNKNTVIFDEVEVSTQQRSWFDRTFAKMEKDSLRSTIFLMMAGTLGAGVYALHAAFHEIGIIWAILLLVFGCVSSLLALDMYIHASRVSGDPESVGEINTHILGNGFNIFATSISGIYLYLIMISFTVCISKLMFELIKGPFAELTDIEVNDNDFFFYHRPTTLVIAVLGFLLVIPKSVDMLSMFAIYCFIIHFYIISVLVVQTYSYASHREVVPDVTYNIASFDIQKLFSNFGVAICTFNNVPNFMMVRTLVKSPSTNRLRKIFNRANWIIMVIYIITAICGYITIGPALASRIDLMIFREKNGETDYFMQVGQFLLAFSLIISYSLMAFALKMMIIPYLPGTETMKHISTTAVLTLSASLIGMNFESVSSYINLAGSFGGTFIVIIFPALLALKSGYTKDRILTWGIKSWLLVGTVSGGISTYYALMNILHPPVHDLII